MEETIILETASEKRETFFLYLYKKAFPSVARYVSRMGGTLEEAKDIFQDALLIYHEKHIQKALDLRSTDKAYILGISKHLWSKRYQDKNRFSVLKTEDPSFFQEPAGEPSSEKLLKFLEATGAKCMNLLKAFYYDKLPLSGIAEQFGFSGTRSATVQKYKCLEKIRETIKEKTLGYEDFID
jgi:DNA-directed RNA polymerase specialized sigma24 family protein